MLHGLSVLLDDTSGNMPYGQRKAIRACHFNGGNGTHPAQFRITHPRTSLCSNQVIMSLNANLNLANPASPAIANFLFIPFCPLTRVPHGCLLLPLSEI